MLSDFKLALRSLRATPAYVATALLTLALGIGLNTSVVSLIDALLYRPAPFAGPHALVGVHGATTQKDEGYGSVLAALTSREVEFIRENATTLHDISILDGRDSTLLEPGLPSEFMHGQAVSVETLPSLGLPAALGRVFTPDDFRPGAPPVLLLSHAFWQRRFGGDPGVIGRTLRFNNGDAVTVVGVMPLRFSYPLLWDYWGETTFWRPLVFDAAIRSRPDDRRFQIVARLRDGIASEAAVAELAALAARLAGERPAGAVVRTFRVTPLHAAVVPPFYRELAWLTYGVSASLLLMACANLAGLQLARLLGRSREFAVRAALGASRRQLGRQFALESIFLTLGGAALGLVVALAGNALLENHVLLYGARGLDLVIHGRVLGFVALTTAATAVFFGAFPAWASSRIDVNEALKQQGRGATAGRNHQRWRRGLIVAQIALALVLLSGAGLLVRGFHQLLRRDLGWQPDGLTSAELSLSPRHYDSPERVRAFYRDLQARLGVEPGVEGVSLSNLLPLTSYWSVHNLVLPDAADQPPIPAYAVTVTPGYFDTLRIPLREGRSFPETARPGDPPQIVINASLARRLFGERSALGQRVGFRTGQALAWHEVIGVSADVTLIGSPGATDSPFQVHQPVLLSPGRYLNIAVRGPAGVNLGATLRRVIGQIDPELAPRRIRTLREYLAVELGNLQRVGQALSVFALLGLGLTALGLYAVISDHVTQRRGEFGIRLALGAQRHDIIRLVLGSATRVTVLGLAMGLGGVWAVNGFLVSTLPSLVVSSVPFLIFLGGILAAVALLAAFLPARRAATVDPMTTLRSE